MSSDRIRRPPDLFVSAAHQSWSALRPDVSHRPFLNYSSYTLAMARIPLAQLTPENLNQQRSTNTRIERCKRSFKDLITMASSYKPPPPLTRDWHTVSPRKKLQIVLYFLHHRIEEPEVRQGLKQKQRCLKGLKWDGWWRPPTAAETAAHFRIPERTAKNKWYKRHEVVTRSRACRRDTLGAAGERHPELELELF
jgi:hypothetical protein